MSINEFPEDWSLYREISELPYIEPGEFNHASTSTLQQFLKCSTADILNGSLTSDEVIAEIPIHPLDGSKGLENSYGVVSPQEGLSPAGTPPTSPPQPTFDDSELPELLSSVSSDLSELTGLQSDVADNLSGTDLLDFDLSSLEQIPDVPENNFQISKEELNLLQDCWELNNRCEELEQQTPAPTATRHHPYKEPSDKTVEKKLRKKQQNKDAASRYRLKKKAQKQEQGGELDDLLEKNKNLQSECKEKMREIAYLKELLRDVCKAKGLEPPISVL